MSEVTTKPALNEDARNVAARSVESLTLPGQATPIPTSSPEPEYLDGVQLAVVFGGMLLSLLLIALDQTLLATALPKIASDFQAYSQQGWVSSAFILTLRIVPAKWALIGSIAMFEVGSAMCGAGQNVNILIGGRAVSGVGAAGMFIAMIQILSQVVRLEARAKLFGLFGAVFGLSSIIGPLIGGALTDHINLPIGGTTIFIISLILKAAPPLGADLSDRSYRSLFRQILRMDWVGAALVLSAVTCLVLALQWGGNTKPWSSGPVLACLILAPVLGIALGFWEWFIGARAMVPVSLFKSISVPAIIGCAFTNRFAQFVPFLPRRSKAITHYGPISRFIFVYYIPLYYEAVKGKSATSSGIALLPTMLGVVLTAIISGQIVARLGRYWPFLIFAPIPICLGSGLMYTVDQYSSSAKLIGYQILLGVGVGCALQNALLAIQAEFQETPALIAQATGLVSFGQFLGGVVALGAGEAAFSTQLGKNLEKYAPQASASLIEIVKESPTLIRSQAPVDQLSSILTAYVKSLQIVFVIVVPVGALGLGATMFISNLSIKKPKAASETAADEGNVKKEEV
ncbi:Major facilitator transporter-like protein [Pseudohyphozyma bogoriensis]|nr:Major facilitator transporter-like protein [Pseudohyphozyma bogoriensis]